MTSRVQRSLRGSRGFAWVSAACIVACAACGRSDADVIAEATKASDRDSLPVQFVGRGVDERTGRPVGYPDDVPLVEGAESISGGVEPGVVSTAMLRYRMTRAQYVAALASALGSAGFRVTDEGIGPTGAQGLRARKGSRSVSFLVNEEGATIRVDVLSLAPRAPGSGTSSAPR